MSNIKLKSPLIAGHFTLCAKETTCIKPAYICFKGTSKFSVMQLGCTPNSFPVKRVMNSKDIEDFHPCGDYDDVKEDVKFSDIFAVDSGYKDAFIKFCRDLEKCNEMIFLNTSGGYKKDLQITTVGGVFRDLNGNVIGLPFHGRVDASGSFEAELLATQFGLEVASHVPITLPILVNMAGHEAVKMINTSCHTDEKFFEAYTKKSDRAHKSNLTIGSFRTILNIKNVRFVPEKKNRLAHQLSTLAAGRSNKKIHFLKEPFSHRISEAYKLDKERKSFL